MSGTWSLDTHGSVVAEGALASVLAVVSMMISRSSRLITSPRAPVIIGVKMSDGGGGSTSDLASAFRWSWI